MKNSAKRIFALILVLIFLLASVSVLSSCSCVRLTEEDADVMVRNKWEENAIETDNVIIKKLEQRSEYELISFEKDGSSYCLVYMISAPNIKSALEEYISENADEIITTNILDEVICDLIDNSGIESTEAEVYIVFENGEYKILFSDTFFDAMYGGIYSFSIEALSDIANG